FAIWWAWVNFTWFASAYDTDDVPYRLLTLLQIGGVLVVAAGIPAAFEHYNFTTVVVGYVIMRVAMVAQWVRVARQHPAGRPTALRYAVGIALCQVGWVLRLALPQPWGWIGFGVLAAAELAVPAWAELRGPPTSWHPGHINERYGLFALIVLGESVAAATIAVQAAITDHGISASLLVLAAAGLLLVFGLWWSYFKHDATAALRRSTGSVFVWAYAQYGILATIAAVGAGLQVAAQTAGHATHLSPTFAAYTVAVPVTVFVLLASGVYAWIGQRSHLDQRHLVVVSVLILLTPLAAGLLSLGGAIVAIGLLVASLVITSVILAHRATSRTDQQVILRGANPTT
ncbi:MAG TPA: low temperature requirement protein A, partial [Actinomycetes bacterium]|nr:low temperature requirement protein A [Actinomycetes bacterium]